MLQLKSLKDIDGVEARGYAVRGYPFPKEVNVEPTNELVYIVDDEANVGEALSTLLQLTVSGSGSSLRDKTSLISPAKTLVPV